MRRPLPAETSAAPDPGLPGRLRRMALTWKNAAAEAEGHGAADVGWGMRREAADLLAAAAALERMDVRPADDVHGSGGSPCPWAASGRPRDAVPGPVR